MDEGAVVAYASRVLDGAVPHRDFLTFYGPGSSWIVAGAFATFGESVGTERAVGLVYRVAIVLALFLIGLRLAGIVAGLLAAFVAAVIMGHDPIWAYATYGALAFGLLGIALAIWAATAAGRRAADRGSGRCGDCRDGGGPRSVRLRAGGRSWCASAVPGPVRTRPSRVRRRPARGGGGLRGPCSPSSVRNESRALQATSGQVDRAAGCRFRI